MRRESAASRGWLTAAAFLIGACSPADENGSPRPPVASETAVPSPDPSRLPTASPLAPTLAPDASPLAGDAWELLAEAPIALTEVAAAAHRGRLWVAGGFVADGSASSSVFVMDTVDDHWSQSASLPEAIHHAALVSDGERLYLIGGFVGAGFERPTDAVWAMDEAEVWDPAPPLPEPRGAGAATSDGERIVFAGGVGPDGVAADVYALADGEWEPIGALAEPRQHLAAASDGAGRTWFLGGRHSSLATNVGTVELVANSDVLVAPPGLTPRSGVGAFWMAGFGACLVGGETPDGTSSLVECVDEVGQVEELPRLTVARHGLGVAVLADGVYAVLGGEEPGLFVSVVVEWLPVE